MKSPLSSDEQFVIKHHPDRALDLIIAARQSGKTLNPIQIIACEDQVLDDIAKHQRIERWVAENPLNGDVG